MVSSGIVLGARGVRDTIRTPRSGVAGDGRVVAGHSGGAPVPCPAHTHTHTNVHSHSYMQTRFTLLLLLLLKNEEGRLFCDDFVFFSSYRRLVELEKLSVYHFIYIYLAVDLSPLSISCFPSSFSTFPSLTLTLSFHSHSPPLFFITLYLSHVPCPHASHRPHTPIPEAETFHPVHDSLQVPFTSVSVSSCPIPCSSALSSLLGSPCAPIPQQNGREEREEEGRQRREGGGQR